SVEVRLSSYGFYYRSARSGWPGLTGFSKGHKRFTRVVDRTGGSDAIRQRTKGFGGLRRLEFGD
ncbi:MAG: hypothetical protein WA510_03285, partial [Acidobacteriaceae bacterium]